MIYDAVIIGHGPAAVSASLYLLRANLTVCLVGAENSGLLNADKIENYYGFPEPVSGKTLFENGLLQAKKLGAHLFTDEIVNVTGASAFTAEGKHGSYIGKALLFATGASRVRPRIDGLSALEGRGVSYCAVCDGFFYRGKRVAVLGAGEYALHEAAVLLPLAASVTLLSNGAPAPERLPDGLTVDSRSLHALEGDAFLTAARFADGENLSLDGLFVALGVASAVDFARKIGLETDGQYIKTDSNGQTNYPGIYAAGDCTGGFLQIAKAVSEGAHAAAAMIVYLKNERKS